MGADAAADIVADSGAELAEPVLAMDADFPAALQLSLLTPSAAQAPVDVAVPSDDEDL